MPASSPLLEIRGLTLRRSGCTLLNGIDMDISAAEVHSLIGGNGCGKTSLAKAIMGCEGYQPDAGDIRFDGQRINEQALHERARLGITLAWQEPARFEGLRVREYLTLKHPERDPAALLRQVGLVAQTYLERMLDQTLSGGERKRIELASLMGLEPRLALLDEPAAGIDLRSIDEIVQLVGALKAAGSAVLLITHREEMAAVADTASQMCGGHILFSGSPTEVAANYRQHHCEYCDGEACRDD